MASQRSAWNSYRSALVDPDENRRSGVLGVRFLGGTELLYSGSRTKASIYLEIILRGPIPPNPVNAMKSANSGRTPKATGMGAVLSSGLDDSKRYGFTRRLQSCWQPNNLSI